MLDEKSDFYDPIKYPVSNNASVAAQFDIRRWMLDVRRFLEPLLQHRLVKFVPVVKIVQVHRVFRSSSVVVDAARAQNALARFAIMIIAAYRGVVLFDRFSF